MEYMSKRVWQLMLGLFVFVILSEVSFSEIINLEDAINKAGHQRMLTQRMLKSYCMKGLDVQADVAHEQLTTSVALFDEQLNELILYSPNQIVKKKLKRVESLWRPVRAMITGPVNRNSAEAILQKNDALLLAADAVVKQLEKLSSTPHGRLVSISGRQRMLSQRLAKFYMLRAWGVDNTIILVEENKAEEAFRKAMEMLMQAKENTTSISNALKQANMQWDLLKYGLDRKGNNYVPLIVAMTSENLLHTMDYITGMYSELSR
jgi:hypothetical protein